MNNPYTTHPGFPSRVTHAERCLKLLAEAGTVASRTARNSVASDRKFDSCLEMNDGDAIVSELMRRAKADPVLMREIEKSCGNAAAVQHWYKISVYRARQSKLELWETLKQPGWLRSIKGLDGRSAAKARRC